MTRRQFIKKGLALLAIILVPFSVFGVNKKKQEYGLFVDGVKCKEVNITDGDWHSIVYVYENHHTLGTWIKTH